MDIKNKKASVAGFGKSGKAAAEILASFGCEVLISDSAPENKFADLLKDMNTEKIKTEFGGNTENLWKGKDFIIVSPGVSIYSEQLQNAIKAGVPLIGEIEFSYMLAKAPVTAVTGTNGKSTTTSLIHKIISDSGIKSILAGNIGNPLSKEIMENPEAEAITAEVSSFQLETVSSFRPHIAILTNITSDHTDRHRGFENYVSAKAKIFANQTEEDYAILNADDEEAVKISKTIKSKILWFSVEKEVSDGFFLKDGTIFKASEGIFTQALPADSIKLPGIHNMLNALASLCAASIFGISPEKAAESIASYKPLHHRMEHCGRINGVDFYDDSKGTNPGAVIAAINSFSRPRALIAGGRDKGMDFDGMTSEIAEKIHTLVAIGESGPKLADMCRSKGMKRIKDCGRDFEKAIITAYEAVKDEKGCVILSPAGASFDMFKNAEHRGDEFQRIVKKLESGSSK